MSVLVDYREVKRLTGYSKATIKRRLKAGTIPKPVHLEGDAPNSPNRWVLEEIKQYVASALAKRDGGAA